MANSKLPPELVNEKLVSQRTLQIMIDNVSQRTIYKWIEVGVLPRPIQISRRNYWKMTVIIAWLQTLGPRSDTTPAQEGEAKAA